MENGISDEQRMTEKLKKLEALINKLSKQQRKQTALYIKRVVRK